MNVRHPAIALSTFFGIGLILHWWGIQTGSFVIIDTTCGIIMYFILCSLLK